VVSGVRVLVIILGDLGTCQDTVEAVSQPGASAVAVASIFHFIDQTRASAKKALAAFGIPVRQSFTEIRVKST